MDETEPRHPIWWSSSCTGYIVEQRPGGCYDVVQIGNTGADVTGELATRPKDAEVLLTVDELRAFSTIVNEDLRASVTPLVEANNRLKAQIRELTAENERLQDNVDTIAITARRRIEEVHRLHAENERLEQALPEVQCPKCDAVIRARMADIEDDDGRC